MINIRSAIPFMPAFCCAVSCFSMLVILFNYVARVIVNTGTISWVFVLSLVVVISMFYRYSVYFYVQANQQVLSARFDFLSPVILTRFLMLVSKKDELVSQAALLSTVAVLVSNTFFRAAHYYSQTIAFNVSGVIFFFGFLSAAIIVFIKKNDSDLELSKLLKINCR